MRRLSNALASLGTTDRRGFCVWGVSMVRNEQDIIEESIRNLFEQGVEALIVADNLSTDHTPDILADLARELPVHVVNDPIDAYFQADKMTLLARAATRCGATWIVPFDADEIWRGSRPGITLAAELRSIGAPIARAPWFDYVPLASDHTGSFAHRFQHRLPKPNSMPKVAFRANWLARIRVGNHDVLLPQRRYSDGLRVAHFRYRSVEQMVQKAVDGSSAVVASGVPIKVPYWHEVASGGEAEAKARLEALAGSAVLIHDPVEAW
jgi:glycosyltransferase involved in cell wall biosynthesis